MDLFYRPFANSSPINTRIANPSLVGNAIPASPYNYSSMVSAGAGSPGVFKGSETGDDADCYWPWKFEQMYDETEGKVVGGLIIPHFPSGVWTTKQPEDGTDGHMVIVSGNTSYEAWQCWRDNRTAGIDRWRARVVAHCALDGSGFGTMTTPGIGYAGVRASGASLLAGLIRRVEWTGGDDGGIFDHALAISVMMEAMSRGPVWPATSEDANAGGYGGADGFCPMGSRWMLPSSFDEKTIGDPLLRKIARTMKPGGYPAIVLDENTGCPLIFYAERGSGMDRGWQNQGDFEKIRMALRRVA